MIYEILLMIIGFFLLIKGADFVVKASSDIAKKFNLPEILIGIVIVGLGTSLPEIIVTITSALKGSQDIIIGNSIGSCICNLLLVIGIASICNPLKIDLKIFKVHLPVSVITIWILILVCNFGTERYMIVRSEAIFLLFLAFLYIIYTVYEGKNESEKTFNQEMVQVNFVEIFMYLLLGIVGLKYGADFVIDGAVAIAEFFGVSQYVISITIVALGTSLPEIVTTVIATLQKQSGLAIGNVIGSNIFNICLLPGIGSLINPINFDVEFNKSLIFLLIVTMYFLIFDLLHRKRTISRNQGVIFILLFCLYITCLF